METWYLLQSAVYQKGICMNHAPFAIKETLLFGFKAFKHNLWLLLAISLIGITINQGSRAITTIIAGKTGLKQTNISLIMAPLFGKNKSETPTNAPTEISDKADHSASSELETSNTTKTIGLLLILLIWVIASVLNLMLLMGWNQIGLDIYDTGTSSFHRLFAPSAKAATFLITALCYSIICLLGTMLLIIPGIIWAIKYSYADLIVVDSESKAFEALKASARLTHGYKWDILFFYFISFFILVASVITLIGPFILIYVLFLSRVYIYRKLQERWQLQHQPPTPFMP
jgi:hypothetical protein